MISGCRNVHPSSTRSLTIREATRAQSFPDEFIFTGKWGDIRRAIGNAVPLFWLPASQKLYINNSLTSNLSEISCFQIELQLCRMLSLATSLKLNKAKSRCIMDFVIVLIGSLPYHIR